MAEIGDAAEQSLETMCSIERAPHSIFGVVCEPRTPAKRSDLGLIFLNSGAVRHIGPNRMWVKAARRWAARGVTSLRIDFAGIGESDGGEIPGVGALYQGDFLPQVEMAIAALRLRTGARRFALMGICSGAFWAFQAAIDNSDIQAAILLNPRLFFWDPEVDRRRMLRRTMNGLTGSSTWHRLARGEIKAGRIQQAAHSVLHSLRRTRADAGRHFQIPPAEMARALAKIESNRCRLSMIFTEGEPLLREMEEESQMPPENSNWIRCVRIPSAAGHTFRPMWSQLIVNEWIDRELETVVEPLPPAQNQRAATVS